MNALDMFIVAFVIILVIYLVFMHRSTKIGKSLYEQLTSSSERGGWIPVPEEFAGVVDGFNWDISPNALIYTPYIPKYQNSNIPDLSYSHANLATYFGVIKVPQNNSILLDVNCEENSYNEIIISHFPSWEKITSIPLKSGNNVLNLTSSPSTKTEMVGKYIIPPEPITILWVVWGKPPTIASASDEDTNLSYIQSTYNEENDTHLEKEIEEIFDQALVKLKQIKGGDFSSYDKPIRSKLNRNFPRLEYGKTFGEEVETYPFEEWMIVTPIRTKTINAVYHKIEILAPDTHSLTWQPISLTNKNVDAYYFTIPPGVYSFKIVERIGGIHPNTKIYPLTLYHIHQTPIQI